MTVTAKYEDGVFKPIGKVVIDEGTIVEIHIPPRAAQPKRKSRSVGDFAFFGMWKDRTDIGDSVDYVAKLRRNLRS